MDRIGFRFGNRGIVYGNRDGGYKMKFFIPGTLPSLNEVIEANRRNKYAGAMLKRETQKLIEAYIYISNLTPVDYPVVIELSWQEPNNRRDVDNIQSSKKFILDALVEMKILPNDTRKWVTQIYDTVTTDKEHPGVWVLIRRAE